MPESSAAKLTTETPPRVTLDDTRRVVRQRWGFDGFRPLQQQAIEHCLAGRDSVVILPTGGGKSLCFQAPASILPGTAVVVSPLISLMKDQVDALRTNGVPAAFYNSSLSYEERTEVVNALASGKLKLLYLAPEGLLRESTLDLLASVQVSLIAIDEAHCISSWGHDFRPEYRGLRSLKQRFAGVGIHAYTATATQRVRDDIANELALDNPALLVGDFDRPNLNYRVQRKQRGLDQVTDVVERHRGESGIVYCISRKEVEKTSAALNELGYSSLPYHAGLSDEERVNNQEAFLEERVDIVVATVAFGMGIDKSNVRFVVHAAMPKSLEAYQQESGRAGRDGLEAECCLFFGNGDYGTWKRIMANSGDENPAALSALQAIDRFCNSTRCRHQLLVEHFGQKLEKDHCGACDACLDQLERIDDEAALIVAQKILSCVLRLQQGFGADYTALVLAGSGDQRIIERRHDELSTYGLLKTYPRTTIRTWIEQLISQNCASKEGEYNLLRIRDKGWEVLRGQHTPTLLKPAPPPSKNRAATGTKKSGTTQGGDWSGVDRDLFESLRGLRRDIAGEKGVPAYIVFGDATLRDLARCRPTSRAEFLDVHGVGEKKCADYGSRFLKHLANYRPEI